MSRHRNVRALNYEDEYDGYDDVYGHSVEDDYCISPGTASQFLYNREHISSLSSYLEPGIPEEKEDSGSDQEAHDSLRDSANYQRPKLSDVDEARLNSCLEEIRNVIGESTPEHVLVDAVVKYNYSYEKALDAILSANEKPKPQREPRQRRERTGARATSSKNSANENTSTLLDRTQLSGDVAGGAKPKVPENHTLNVATNNIGRMTFSAPSSTKHTARTTNGFSNTGQDNSSSSTVHITSTEPSIGKNHNSTHINAQQEKTDKENHLLAPATSAAELGMSTPKKDNPDASVCTPVLIKSASKRADKIDVKKEYEKRKAEGKDLINLVVIGHVDAGKSTLMGHLLFQLGAVNKRTMHKYEQESKKLGKASFAFAWVLDETEEERSRGVTMDVAQTRFQTDNKMITLLDAPGHKDFIPNMITGAAQADVAILVVNSTRGEFETGFETGGQTREHAMLIRSLGVSQLLVAVNKMDTVEWSQIRYNEIVKKLGNFLRQAGFKEADVSFIPCSGLSGENLAKRPTAERLMSWYRGPTLLQQIDTFKPPERPIEKSLRLCVTDVFKGMGSGFSVSGTIQAGYIQPGERILVMPHGETATVKGLTLDELPVPVAFAGDTVILTLTGMDIANVNVGSIVCESDHPVKSTCRIRARVVIFNIEVPITKGFPVVLHYQSLSEPANIRKLISQLHKSTGEVIKKKPRCLTKNNSAIIELEVNRPICVELYKDYKDLGRFMLRYGGVTMAAGLVTEIMDSKASRD